jgi:hypothetical protein
VDQQGLAGAEIQAELRLRLVALVEIVGRPAAVGQLAEGGLDPGRLAGDPGGAAV